MERMFSPPPVSLRNYLRRLDDIRLSLLPLEQVTCVVPVRVSLPVLLFPAALILAVQVTGQVPFLEQLILAANSKFCGSSSSDFMSLFKLELAMRTLTLLLEAAFKVTVALTSLMLVVACASTLISEVLPTLAVMLLGTLRFTRATSEGWLMMAS